MITIINQFNRPITHPERLGMVWVYAQMKSPCFYNNFEHF